MTAEPQSSTTLRHAQALRLKRMGVSGVTFFSAFIIAAVLFWLGYISLDVLMIYAVMLAGINLLYVVAVLTNFNLRFADPNMSMVQICLAIAAGYFVMYHAQGARTAFLLLIVPTVTYSLFKFRPRDFGVLTAIVLLGYAGLIVLMLANAAPGLNLQVEVLQLVTLTACMLQFSGVGKRIVSLRAKVSDNKRELEKRQVQLQQALARIEQMAMRDELTGAFNRRHLMETIRIEKQRSRRTGSPFTICILDIDFFKKVNDSYGHLAGDQILRDIAATASAALRQTDYFGRYGGEEFACVLTDTGAAGAMITAERIRNSIAALRFPAMDPGLEVTVSIGVADCGQSEEPDSAFKRADEALYQAKKGGRNRCIVLPALAGPLPARDTVAY